MAKKLPKKIAIAGLGKMGKNLALQLTEKGWEVTAYNRTSKVTKEIARKKNIKGAYTLEELVADLPKPRVVWIMVTHNAVDEFLFGQDGLVNILDKGDIVIDGGNSFYKDSIRRGAELAKHKIEFLDVGVSGGPKGAREGAATMIGGKQSVYKKLEHLFADMSVEKGYHFFKGHGAGHFVKMVHNGIEYGMMQAIGEGFEILKKSKFDLNLKNVAEAYNHGTVIDSRLIGWLESAYKKYGQDLIGISGKVGHTGEGQWTAQAAKELGVKAEIIEKSYKFRVNSAKKQTYTGQVVSALRGEFGGHDVKTLKGHPKKQK